MLGYLAASTYNASLGTSIVSIHSRSAASIAMAAATIDAISKGRFVLGLGASSRKLAEDWHSSVFSNNLIRMREYVEVIRMILSGERVNYAGSTLKVKDMRIGIRPSRVIPIYIAATKERMLRLASSIGDGVILFLRPIDELYDTIHTIKSINKECEVCYVVVTSVSDDREEALRRAKSTIAFYTAVGEIYAEFLSRRFKDEVYAIRASYTRNGLRDIHMHVSDRMLDALTVAGSIDECISKFERLKGTGIDTLIIQYNPVDDDTNRYKRFIESLGELRYAGE
jgi:alkanesulfonate monooxygenase SsuD/methylene tetrahydromethanopterin reductase-like flavin-dependent oxidoreductase (luciferase family)